MSDDYSDCYYNPAGLVQLSSRQIGSLHADLLGVGLLNHNFFCFAEPDTGMGSGALSWSHLSANFEPETWSYSLISYSYADFIFREDTSSHSWGTSLKIINQDTPFEDASGYSLDLGYLAIEENISWGICLQNIFSKIHWKTGRNETLPATLNAGLSLFPKKEVLYAFDLVLASEDIPRALRMGAEWKMGENITFRTGLVQRFQKGENISFSAGIGFKTAPSSFFKFSFNYAFVSSQTFPGTHYFSLSFFI
ncbi:hypothetical protein H5U35_03135 [Candidatus Aerophobetes bacterium]|nr:hypothetical protein [Candidatus Aerophobetes bacterium]